MVDYLVTGGAGFIGSNIVETLVERGKSVRVLDDLSSGKRSNIGALRGQIEFIKGSLTHGPTVERAVRGATYVLHQAAIPSVPGSIEDPLKTNKANVTGTLALLLAARGARVQRFVFSSSSSVYGDEPGLPKTEESRLAPRSPYAASKLIGEHYCRMFHQLYGLGTISLRYFNVYGPRQNPASAYAAVVPKFIECLAQGRAPDVHGDGLQTRDFTYVADVVRANLLACEAPGEALGQVINIACHQQVSVLDLFHMIRDLVAAALLTRRAADIEPNHTESRAGDVRHSFADITRARELLGYEPQWSLRDGLAKTVEHFTGRIR